VIDQVVAWTAQADWSGCYLLTAAAGGQVTGLMWP
jgi:hypothetical protein